MMLMVQERNKYPRKTPNSSIRVGIISKQVSSSSLKAITNEILKYNSVDSITEIILSSHAISPSDITIIQSDHRGTHTSYSYDSNDNEPFESWLTSVIINSSLSFDVIMFKQEES